jgi:hypothetical protein
LQREDLVVPGGPEKSPEERLASLERAMDHLKTGLGLLGLAPCSCCGIYYLRAQPGALFKFGESVCFNCIAQWWSHRCPELGTEDRPRAERELRRWLITHHRAEVIGKLGRLPPPDQLLTKLVTGCEQCGASGKIGGKRCPHCDGQGTVWVVIRNPDIGLS